MVALLNLGPSGSKTLLQPLHCIGLLLRNCVRVDIHRDARGGMPELRLDRFQRLTLSVQQRGVCDGVRATTRAALQPFYTRDRERARAGCVCRADRPLVGKYRRVGLRLASLLLTVSQECCDNLRPEGKISNAASPDSSPEVGKMR